MGMVHGHEQYGSRQNPLAWPKRDWVYRTGGLRSYTSIGVYTGSLPMACCTLTSGIVRTEAGYKVLICLEILVSATRVADPIIITLDISLLCTRHYLTVASSPPQVAPKSPPPPFPQWPFRCHIIPSRLCFAFLPVRPKHYFGHPRRVHDALPRRFQKPLRDPAKSCVERS